MTPLMIYGEEENKQPIPDWVKTIVAAEQGEPESRSNMQRWR